MTCMIIIFVMSHQPAVISADISGSITEWPVVKVFLDVFGLDKLDQGTQEHIIRKLAHMLEYFGLSMCVTMYLLTLKGQLKIKTMLGALGFSITYAISDEVHQLFVEGRAGMVKDVL
ncbi:MAG: VanZ family protein, partial [Lachnospiraceae bacterium]|nr:VanZ family protein [Lachnospiraceae bacterium]